jgi:hypothetical protein
MKQFTDTDFVIAASVNVLTLRAIAAGVGAPGWAGAMVAAAAMAIAGDETVDPQLRKIAGALSAPGAVTVQILKDNQELTAPCCAPCAAGEPCND